MRHRFLLLAWLLPWSALADIDTHDLWRRQTIDICQRLPTLDEIACIESAGGAYPAGSGACDFAGTLETCTDSTDFADMIAEWVDDFILPVRDVPFGNSPAIHRNAIAINGEPEPIYYWYQRSILGNGTNSWGDCLATVSALDPADIPRYLDRAPSPYWDEPGMPGVYEDPLYPGVRFVYVCRKSSFIASSCSAEGPPQITAALPNTAPCVDPYTGAETEVCTSIANTDRFVCAQNGNRLRCTLYGRAFPCGCGPNLRWCLQISSAYDEDGGLADAANTHGTDRLIEHAKAEPRRLVREIVLGAAGLIGADVPFTDIFNAPYSVRTGRLQHFYEVLQGDRDVDGAFNPSYDDYTPGVPYTHYDGCRSMLKGLDRPAASECPDDEIMPGLIDYSEYDANDIYGTGGDWQLVRFDTAKRTAYSESPDPPPGEAGVQTPLAYRGAGVLTTWQLLVRQPTQPNYANRLHSFWTCEDIGWRSWTATPGTSGANHTLNHPDGPLTFSPLSDNPAVDAVPFEAPGSVPGYECRGCHMTVNPLGAFRNRWTSQGIYETSESEDGVFLGETGSGLADLGQLMADSSTVHACIVNRIVERLTGHFMDRNDPELAWLLGRFQAGFDIKALHLDVLETNAYRRPR